MTGRPRTGDTPCTGDWACTAAINGKHCVCHEDSPWSDPKPCCQCPEDDDPGDTSVYYDDPVLGRIIGYRSQAEFLAAVEAHNKEEG